MSFTQNRDEADICSPLCYTHQIYFKTQQLWCNRNRYQGNNVPRTNPWKPRRKYLKLSWDFFHKETLHRQEVLFQVSQAAQWNKSHIFSWPQEGLDQSLFVTACGSSASVLVSQATQHPETLKSTLWEAFTGKPAQQIHMRYN